MKSYTYYLFDADGTILDSTELIYKSFSYACKKFANHDLTFDQIKSHIGLPMRSQIEMYLGPLSDEEYAHIYHAQIEYQLGEYQQYLRLFPGVTETLKVLKAQGKYLAVVSARKQETLPLYLRETGVYDMFDAVVTPECTDGINKPDPAPALKALELMSGTAEESLFIGDVDADMECGTRAGMDTAFVAWSHNHPDSLNSKPTMILDNIRNLVVN